ncbi:thioredoxin domain-containing protein [Geomesophilobacter sediminis]|uniref:Thioredoxin domain-containing protein n=1 Tax=Geomesophilobacter sediminis TaxID=2798584 RepID=A0A8J7M255_9BACT|nr:thioredoxin domain-containing protein [Geomesophilobacter sediminis]MBJ6727247.1 thioredoxin domain-containing protein [Geomesophilobacter sediminis]
MTDPRTLKYQPLPGTQGLPTPPVERFEALLVRRGTDYRPRTRHLLPDGSARYTNRLFLESSPYLLQHAHNPVNWFPWGKEALDLAKELNRPLLVSIGYATCHWCHVMEEESFEDEEIAEYLNANFIPVKIDREERPDLDAVYMSALQAMTGQGGWPLNMWLTPEGKPFYGGTYFPPKGGGHGTGFLEVLRILRSAYDRDPERVAQSSEQLTQAVRRMLAPAEAGEVPQREAMERAIHIYRERMDTVNGGVTGAPKFPSSLPVRLLFREYRRTEDPDLLRACYLTLRNMARGGIYDQVAGGFHRYATDSHWRIPHFEKMLYDNALLAVTYLEGFQLTGDREFARVAREVLSYLRRDMAAPGGAFYSATDADSLNPEGEREEGYFFTWTPQELTEVLGKTRGDLVAAVFGVTEGGNFEGRTILHRSRDLPAVAAELRRTEEEASRILDESRELLYQARARRPQPITDRKIIASWNGLAISAFAKGGFILDDGAAVEQAAKTASFILEEMLRDGRLAHSYQEGSPKGEGFLDDYAFFIAGLIDLFEATGEPAWLERVQELTAVVAGDFEDDELGGFFSTGPRHEELIAREKPSYDGAIPSGNSVMAMNLLRLHLLTELPEYGDRAQRVFSAFSSTLAANPTALSEMLLALDFHLDLPRQILIVAPEGDRKSAGWLLGRLRGEFLPNRVLAVVTEGEQLNRAAELVPALQGKTAQGDQAMAYLCENRTCLLPTSDPELFEDALKKRR